MALGAEEWQFQIRTPACLSCGRSFAAGDVHFSALHQEQATLTRRDYCQPCWEGTSPAGYFSFWRGVVPEPEEVEKKRRLDASLNTDTLLDVLKEMPDDPDPAKRRFRFVLALMLMRRKKLRLLQIARGRSGTDGGDQDYLVFTQTGRGARLRFEVADVKMGAQEMIAAQDEVGRLLALGGVECAVSHQTPQGHEETRAAVATDQAGEGMRPASPTDGQQPAADGHLPDSDDTTQTESPLDPAALR